MSDYAAVDGVIDDWVKATGSTLFTEWAGQPARFFHVPGAPPSECFQISIEPPSADAVTVRARGDRHERRQRVCWKSLGTGQSRIWTICCRRRSRPLRLGRDALKRNAAEGPHVRFA